MYGFQIRSTTAWATALICMILPKIKRVHCHYHVELCTGYRYAPSSRFLSSGCYNLAERETPGGALFSRYFHILFTSRTWQNSHVEALCLWKNKEKPKAEESPCYKKKKKEEEKNAQRRKKKYHSVKKKNSFVKATSTSGAQRWPFCRVFPFPSATFLVIVSSSTLHWAIEIKKSVRNGLNLDPSSSTPWGQVVSLVCGFRKRSNPQACRELFANLC